MNERTLLRCVQAHAAKKPRSPGTLGLVAETYLKRKSRQLGRNAAIVDAWPDILPKELYDHCSISSISNGVLRLEVDAGSYMYELQAIKSELLSYLQCRCGETNIKKIQLYLKKNSTQAILK